MNCSEVGLSSYIIWRLFNASLRLLDRCHLSFFGLLISRPMMGKNLVVILVTDFREDKSVVKDVDVRWRCIPESFYRYLI